VNAAVIAAPLRVEWAALRGARTAVVRTGMGRRRSLRSARKLGSAAVLVAGVAGGLAAHLRVGDLVVASDVRAPDGTVRPCAGAAELAARLRDSGLSVHYGPILSWPRLVGQADRARLAETGALAVDMESTWLAPPEGTPFAVVRAISDTAAAPLLHPAILTNGLASLRALRHTVPALDWWADCVARQPDPRRSQARVGDSLLTFSAQEITPAPLASTRRQRLPDTHIDTDTDTDTHSDTAPTEVS